MLPLGATGPCASLINKLEVLLGQVVYNFAHHGDRHVVMLEIMRELEAQAREYGLTITRGAKQVRLARSGVDVVVQVLPGSIEVTVGLNGIFEVFRGRLERELQRRVPPFLRRCEALSGATGRCG